MKKEEYKMKKLSAFSVSKAGAFRRT